MIDERIDLDLLAAAADARPDWQWVMVGPVVKIDPTSLPRRSNLHYLGMKGYDDLPSYLAGWDAALMPFAANESTRFISPTKTPEYLAGGRPVISTPIRDVVRPYGELVTDHVTVENYWERDKPIYPTGQIELQHHGDALYFKNIFLRELPRKAG